MLETISKVEETLPGAPAPVIPERATQSLRSLGDRVATLAWLVWGELTGNKREFPG